MSDQPISMIQEARYAITGSIRMLAGRADAASYFASDLRGLVSSFIALLVAVGVTLALSAATPAPEEGALSSFTVLFTNVVLYALLVAATWITLRLMGKLDRFIAYLTADNWVNAVISLALAFLGPLIGGSEVVLFAALIVGLIARINIARLVVGLRLGGIVALMIGQAIGMMVGLVVIGAMLAPMIDTTAL
ncbi:hypothetical protein [Pelagibacterium montanilacus]|uniref:hypothetical protein n=1 Tax=Pelagibacterium montanilacus TaxID=2185280 RepID=UPI000F8F5EBD|nr:hypothetical protein [Pelagibacterium montanilacus]